MKALSLPLFLLLSLNVMASEKFPQMTEKNGYVEPFQMFDNVYYVGDKWVSSYAVETAKGLVIIDTLDFPYSKWVPINLKKLGLEDKAVTHIFVTHGHSDHVGGAEFLQSHYGAKVAMTQKGHQLAIEQAQKSLGKQTFDPPKVDIMVQDGAALKIGGETFKFYLTPGHTEGDFSLDFMVRDNGIPHRAFVVGGHSVEATNPILANQFFESMERIRQIASQTPAVTVNLSNHPHKNDLFAHRDRRDMDGTTNPFISKDQFFMFLNQQEALAKDKLNRAALPRQSDH
ncbi:MBL fold metallo-hydrolase [Vibrio ostreicida]|uniref:MBL fold metallo-hydrolase n=1 Tax=Vibrio ostreicida TaxID=526588 RepID=A0ABT8BYX6_9VIBR|nr:MBL fold metallo-hydrolase [Vibrio ostreicida]MDN3611290.1 MBL fold metallo-hydrolase [Vibrio ostreicida]NPD09233.1 MBL fold metallo-hydrolase [Vibrio ostreicida]